MSSAPNPNPLRSRIYNKGFSLAPLPSVQRPKSLYSSSEPLAIRLFSVKNQLAPLIYQTQPSILHKTSQSIGQQANPPKIRKNSFIQKNWEQKEEEEEEEEEEVGRKEVAGGIEEGGEWEEEGWEEREAKKVEIFEKKAVVSYGKDDKFYLSNERFGDLLKSNDFFLRSSGNFKAIRSIGFEQTEMARSKTMLNKLSGKNFLEKRNNGNNEKRNLKSILPPLKKKEEKNEREDDKDENLQIGLKQGKNEHIKSTRPASRIDKYIELILKNVSNLDEFIYLEKKNDEDPYELDIIDYEKVHIKTLYFISD